jgi:hypothetical protein
VLRGGRVVDVDDNALRLGGEVAADVVILFRMTPDIAAAMEVDQDRRARLRLRPVHVR